MIASQNAYAIIKHYESIRLDSYLDPKGIATIGWGHTGRDVEHPTTVSREEAIRLLAEDVHFVEHQLNRMLIREPIAQNQFDAIVSWAFNIGCGRAGKSTLVRLFNLGDDKGAANEFLRWNSCKINGQTVRLKGLTNRRNTERQLFTSGLLAV